MQKKFYSVKQAAEFCGISPRLIYLKVKEREIKFYKINSKIIFDKEDLIKFVTRNEFVTGDELLKRVRERRRS